MIVEWTVAAQSAASGLLGVLVVVILRVFKKRQPIITLPSALAVFLGCAIAPSIPILLLYPFVEPKPNLNEHAVYIVAAAMALAWAVYESIRQGLK